MSSQAIVLLLLYAEHTALTVKFSVFKLAHPAHGTLKTSGPRRWWGLGLTYDVLQALPRRNGFMHRLHYSVGVWIQPGVEATSVRQIP